MQSPNKHLSVADSIAICERRHNLHILSAISCPGGFGLDSSYCCGSDSLHLQCSKKRSQLQVSCHQLWWFSRCLGTVLACIITFSCMSCILRSQCYVKRESSQTVHVSSHSLLTCKIETLTSAAEHDGVYIVCHCMLLPTHSWLCSLPASCVLHGSSQ